MKKPVIGVSAVTAFNDRLYAQRVTYPQAIWAAGGEALLLPCNTDTSNVERIVNMLDGLLVPGGADIDPALYGEEKLPVCGATFRFEDDYDIALIKEAIRQGKPILATCRGMQILNVMFGGTMYQDIPSQIPSDVDHSFGQPEENYHDVTLEADSHLAKILGSTVVKANTSHHQAVKDPCSALRIVGRAPDGVVEAMENEDGSIIGVQWHPERMQDMEIYRELFRVFVEKCKK